MRCTTPVFLARNANTHLASAGASAGAGGGAAGLLQDLSALSFDPRGRQVLPIDWLALRDYYHYGKGRAARRAASARGPRNAAGAEEKSTGATLLWMCA